MSKQFIRIYQQCDFSILKDHVLEYGALSGVCSKCKELNIKLDQTSCPKCGTEFKFIAFQNVKESLPKMNKIKEELPFVDFVDYQDFKKMEGEHKARGILG